MQGKVRKVFVVEYPDELIAYLSQKDMDLGLREEGAYIAKKNNISIRDGIKRVRAHTPVSEEYGIVTSDFQVYLLERNKTIALDIEGIIAELMQESNQ